MIFFENSSIFLEKNLFGKSSMGIYKIIANAKYLLQLAIYMYTTIPEMRLEKMRGTSIIQNKMYFVDSLLQYEANSADLF